MNPHSVPHKGLFCHRCEFMNNNQHRKNTDLTQKTVLWCYHVQHMGRAQYCSVKISCVKVPQSQCVFIIYWFKSCVCVLCGLTALWHGLFCSAEAPREIAVETLSEPLQITAGSAEPTDRQQRRVPLDIRSLPALCHRLHDNTDLLTSYRLNNRARVQTRSKTNSSEGSDGMNVRKQTAYEPVNSLKPTERGSVCVCF